MPTFFTGSSKLVRATTSATLHTIATTSNAAGVVNLRNDAAAHAFAVLDDGSGSLPDRRVVIPPGKSVKLARGVQQTTLKITNASVLATPGYLRKNDKFREFTNLSSAQQLISRLEQATGQYEPYVMSFAFDDCSAVVRDKDLQNSYIGDVNGLLPYVSPSTKYIVGANGFYYPGNTIRTERDRFGGVFGSRIEDSAQNLVFPSTPNASTTVLNGLAITNGERDIFGGDSAAKVLYRDNIAFPLGPSYTAVVSSTSCCAWAIVKKGSGPLDANRYTLRNSTTATNLAVFTVNYDTGVVTHTLGSGATATRLANDWWLIQIGVSSGITSGDTIQWMSLFNGSTDVVGEYAYVSHVQLEPGRTFPTSPIVTTTAAVTRAADTISFPGSSNFSYSQDITLIAEVRNPQYVGARFIISTGNATNCINLSYTASVVQMQILTTSVNMTGSHGSPTSLKVGTAFTSGDSVLALNGNILATDVDVATLAISNTRLGSIAGTAQMNSNLFSALIIPRRITNSQLQEVVT